MGWADQNCVLGGLIDSSIWQDDDVLLYSFFFFSSGPYLLEVQRSPKVYIPCIYPGITNLSKTCKQKQSNNKPQTEEEPGYNLFFVLSIILDATGIRIATTSSPSALRSALSSGTPSPHHHHQASFPLPAVASGALSSAPRTGRPAPCAMGRGPGPGSLGPRLPRGSWSRRWRGLRSWFLAAKGEGRSRECVGTVQCWALCVCKWAAFLCTGG